MTPAERPPKASGADISTRPRRARYAMVDLIRDGVPQAELRRGGDRAVFTALVRTAASAMQRGQSEQEWQALVSETRSALGRQAKLKGGRKERNAASYYRTLGSAWKTAASWLATRPPPATPEDIDRLTATVLTFAADPDVEIPDTWRAVLVHAATFARDRGTTRPALARRAVAEATGLTERTARTALRQLDAAGLLVLAVAGRASADPSHQKAGLYRLPAAEALSTYLCRGTRPMGHPRQTYGTPAVAAVGTPAQTYGTPRDGEDRRMVTIEGPPEALAAFIDELARRGDLRITEREPAAALAQVVPLRSVATSRSA